MYDPSVGRWLSVDPLGFDAKDMNLYRYVGNNSISFLDPTGTVENEIVDMGIIVSASATVGDTDVQVQQSLLGFVGGVTELEMELAEETDAWRAGAVWQDDDGCWRVSFKLTGHLVALVLPADDSHLIRAARIKGIGASDFHAQLMQHERYHYDSAKHLIGLVTSGLETLESWRFCEKGDAQLLYSFGYYAAIHAKGNWAISQDDFDNTYATDPAAALALPYVPSSFWDILHIPAWAAFLARIYPT